MPGLKLSLHTRAVTLRVFVLGAVCPWPDSDLCDALQLRAVLHQLLQRKTAAALHRADHAARAGGVQQRRDPLAACGSPAPRTHFPPPSQTHACRYVDQCMHACERPRFYAHLYIQTTSSNYTCSQVPFSTPTGYINACSINTLVMSTVQITCSDQPSTHSHLPAHTVN